MLCKDIWAAELRIKELRIIYYEYIYYIICIKLYIYNDISYENVYIIYEGYHGIIPSLQKNNAERLNQMNLVRTFNIFQQIGDSKRIHGVLLRWHTLPRNLQTYKQIDGLCVV